MTEGAIKASSQKTKVITIPKHLQTNNFDLCLVNNNSFKLIYHAKNEIQLLNSIQGGMQFLFMYKCDWILRKEHVSHKNLVITYECNPEMPLFGYKLSSKS